jgi:hypothetical protein
VAKIRSEEEQKAVETILTALGHRLVRMKDEYIMREQRGQEPEGVSKGIGVALHELNDLLPRRKRFRERD